MAIFSFLYCGEFVKTSNIGDLWPIQVNGLIFLGIVPLRKICKYLSHLSIHFEIITQFKRFMQGIKDN